MQALPAFDDPNLVVGTEHFADAGVYRIDEERAIVQSVDFFPPIVDDPAAYGRIAAANALGDLYAVGARPITALNIVGFPHEELGLEVLEAILVGGAETVKAAGAVILGGHSVRDDEVVYGLAVTGLVDPRRMLGNSGARPGQALVLTKGLGTGLIATANKAGRCPGDVLDGAIDSMVRLNAAPAEAAVAAGCAGATDITGFGLAVHALEMARASEVRIAIDTALLPVLPGALDLVKAENFSGGTGPNRELASSAMTIDGVPDPARTELLFDPQTAGGLLVAIDETKAPAFLEACGRAGFADAAIIGEVLGGEPALLVR